MTTLRQWQSDCIRRALTRFKSGQNHFFCQATPGAGKTLMSAELASRMLTQDLIDLVICFAPSREVAQGFKFTLESVIGKSFDGRLGSIGAAKTYQAMSFLDQNFWALFQDFRVLAIFDEIHHCADHESGLSNSWGQMIVQRVQDSASYTLAMSGTPWRSDDLGIALARYSSPDGKLICDYRYALAEAVEDGVCRSPRIVLLDNEDVRLKVSNLETSDEKHFSSVADLLADSSVRYQDLLENTKTLEHILSEANARLDLLRARNADAAGLVVASTIRHARMIANVLNSIGEFATVVCSDSKNARDAIQQFRVGDERWIIAVGMIAEGTDVPRIQVCCHLSRIRTELHFRQVLGRSLRRRGGTDSLAWMYLYAEPALEVFAQRVADDLPADKSVLVDGRLQVMTGSVVESESMSIRDVELLPTDNEGHAETTLILDGDSQREAKTLVVSEYFRHQLLAIFSS